MINQRMDYTPFRQTHCRKCKISVEVITERWEVLHHLCAWHVCVEFCSACEAWLEALKQNTKPERGDPFEIPILRYFFLVPNFHLDFQNDEPWHLFESPQVIAGRSFVLVGH